MDYSIGKGYYPGVGITVDPKADDGGKQSRSSSTGEEFSKKTKNLTKHAEASSPPSTPRSPSQPTFDLGQLTNFKVWYDKAKGKLTIDLPPGTPPNVAKAMEKCIWSHARERGLTGRVKTNSFKPKNSEPYYQVRCKINGRYDKTQLLKNMNEHLHNVLVECKEMRLSESEFVAMLSNPSRLVEEMGRNYITFYNQQFDHNVYVGVGTGLDTAGTVQCFSETLLCGRLTEAALILRYLIENDYDQVQIFARTRVSVAKAFGDDSEASKLIDEAKTTCDLLVVALCLKEPPDPDIAFSLLLCEIAKGRMPSSWCRELVFSSLEALFASPRRFNIEPRNGHLEQVKVWTEKHWAPRLFELAQSAVGNDNLELAQKCVEAIAALSWNMPSIRENLYVFATACVQDMPSLLPEIEEIARRYNFSNYEDFAALVKKAAKIRAASDLKDLGFDALDQRAEVKIESTEKKRSTARERLIRMRMEALEFYGYELWQDKGGEYRLGTPEGFEDIRKQHEARELRELAHEAADYGEPALAIDVISLFWTAPMEGFPYASDVAKELYQDILKGLDPASPVAAALKEAFGKQFDS
jgi:hypothetical protein